MSSTIQLHAQVRTAVGRNANQALRKRSRIPAVLYGRGIPSVSLELEAIPFKKVYDQAGESSLIDVMIDGKAVKAIIHDIQRDPMGTDIHHVDFYQVNMQEKIKAEVELVFDGVPPAVKELGGILVKNTTHLEIECLPGDLVHHLTIDLSSLKTFDDQIRVSDLVPPHGVHILNNPEDAIALIEAPRSEEELAELNKAVVEDVSTVEVAKPEKKPEEDAEAVAGAEKKA